MAPRRRYVEGFLGRAARGLGSQKGKPPVLGEGAPDTPVKACRPAHSLSVKSIVLGWPRARLE